MGLKNQWIRIKNIQGLGRVKSAFLYKFLYDFERKRRMKKTQFQGYSGEAQVLQAANNVVADTK